MQFDVKVTVRQTITIEGDSYDLIPGDRLELSDELSAHSKVQRLIAQKSLVAIAPVPSKTKTKKKVSTQEKTQETV